MADNFWNKLVSCVGVSLFSLAWVDYEKWPSALDPEECFLAEKFVDILGSKCFTPCVIIVKW